jgi:16S rRNA (uracil1498-N3)-methyltransferase
MDGCYHTSYDSAMRLTRLYVPDHVFAAGQEVPLSEDQSHYLLRVLRFETGQEVVLFNETSGGWLGSFAVAGKKAAVSLKKQIQKPCPPQDVHVLVAPVKKDAWDFVLEKATELGAAVIRPVFTDYTQNTRVNDARARTNLIEAAQQCERTHVPAYHRAEKLDAVLNGWDKARVLYVALERHDAPSLREAVQKEKPAAILVGPEGGFSPRERDMLLSKEFVVPVSLGPNILRTDTAVAAALAAWL